MIIATSTFDDMKVVAFGGFFSALVAAAVLIPKDLDRTSERAKKIRRSVVLVLGLVFLAFVIGFGVESFGAPIVIVKITPIKPGTML